MEWDILITVVLLGILAVNNYTYFVPPPPPGLEEGGGEKKMPTRNYKRQKKKPQKDKGVLLSDFSSNCQKACAPFKNNSSLPY